MIYKYSKFNTRLAVFFVFFVLIIIGSVNYQIYALASFFPLLTVMATFYFGVFCPDLLPKFMVFFIGIFQDILYGTPIGITSFLLLIYWGIIVSQRKFLVKEQFMVVWLLFILSLFLYMILSLVAHSVYYMGFMFSDAIIMQFVISALIYPIAHKFFNAIHMFYISKV